MARLAACQVYGLWRRWRLPSGRWTCYHFLRVQLPGSPGGAVMLCGARARHHNAVRTESEMMGNHQSCGRCVRLTDLARQRAWR